MPPLSTLSPADGMALTMVGILGFALGMILTILIVMARNAGRKPDIEEGLFDDEEEAPTDRDKKRAGSPQDDEPPRKEWEKDGDWWK
jgi:hypothetical protein